MTDSPKCLHPGCPERPGRLMCWQHWLSRPGHLRGMRLTPPDLRAELVSHLKLTAQDAVPREPGDGR